MLRSSGHEHFRGCLTIPVLDEHGGVGVIYGRRVQKLDPRTATSSHLYLPGPHRGVFNIAAFASVDELVVTESLIDALTLWCAGFRHVTASYGADGWTAEHQAAVEAHGITRVLIAYDRDPAGDAGAKALAAQLTAAGVEWSGSSCRTARTSTTSPSRPPVEAVGPVAPEDVSPVVQPTRPEPTEKASERELVLTIGQRQWRVRGLEKVTSFDLLRVNLLVASEDGGDAAHRFHVDTLDLYSARARAVFVAVCEAACPHVATVATGAVMQ